MAEENKVNPSVDSTTFAQPVPEKTELERIQDRIANFKVSISPTVAQLAQVLMNQSLQNPTKPEDLDGFVQVRNELKLGLDEYQTQLANAQSRMAQLQEEHLIQKQTEVARKENDLIAARDGERKRRKTAEEKARQLEAVLASHGIHIDLDGDGKVGLNVGEETENLTAEQQVTLKKLLDESKAATGGVSRAFEKARALNPEPENQPAPPLASGTTTEEFNEEVAEVNSVYDTPAYDDPVTPNYGSGTKSVAKDGATIPQSETTVVNSNPIISDTNQPDIIKRELNEQEAQTVRDYEDFTKNREPVEPTDKGEVKATSEPEPTFSEQMQDDLEPIPESPKVRMVEEDDIAEFDTPPPAEEEMEEVTIPTESELKGMTKSKIRQEALALGFDGVSTKDPKATMIQNFVEATENFISDLQDSGEFVSATEDSESETDNDRDGGYFK